MPGAGLSAVGTEAGGRRVDWGFAGAYNGGRAARRGQVAGAFSASPEVRGRHVLVVDDVMTTGATMTACARACLEAGAAKVDVFVLARAL